MTHVLREARYPLPPDMPEVFTVWRGSTGLNKATAECGLSWTTNKAYACRYALGKQSQHVVKHNPLLLRRSVRRAVVVYMDASLEYFDEVVFEAAPESTVDGSLPEWLAYYEQCKAEIELAAAEGRELAMLAPQWVTP